MNDGPGAGTVLAAMFLIVAGICIALFGGGCTITLLGSLGDPYLGGGLGLLLIGVSLVILGAGAFLIWCGVKLIRPSDE